MSTATSLSESRVQELLQRTSRTFALSIPLLPNPTRLTVALGYLLFRVADTLEDAACWTRSHRIEALGELCTLLREPDLEKARAASARWLRDPPTLDAHCRELLGELDALLATLDGQGQGAARIVLSHALRTTEGMREVLQGATVKGDVELHSLQELRHYCYIVAGIVGEMLTELFVHDAPQLASVKAKLLERQVEFGEALQLVNILKDQKEDAAEGRILLPAQTPRSEVIALARADLDRAAAYVDTLRAGGAPGGFVAFTTLPRQLAVKALEAVERSGPGTKVPRSQVQELLARVSELLPGR